MEEQKVNSGSMEGTGEACLIDDLMSTLQLTRKVSFIGGGKMASALVDGFVASGLFSKDEIAVSVKTIPSNMRWNERGYKNVYTSNRELLLEHYSGVVFLAVKPQMRKAVLKDTANIFGSVRLVVSIMNGVTLDTLRAELPHCPCILRLMPNIATAVQAGASVVCGTDCISQMKLVVHMMQHIGECIEIKEDDFAAATAVVGCSPAYIFCAIEALADGGVLSGLDRATAMKLAAQATMGAAKMVLQQDKHPAVLKDDVCSAGGSTIYGLRELEKNGFRSSLIEAIYSASNRSNPNFGQK